MRGMPTGAAAPQYPHSRDAPRAARALCWCHARVNRRPGIVGPGARGIREGGSDMSTNGAIDMDKAGAFAFKVLGDVTAAQMGTLSTIADRLGLWRLLA